MTIQTVQPNDDLRLFEVHQVNVDTDGVLDQADESGGGILDIVEGLEQRLVDAVEVLDHQDDFAENIAEWCDENDLLTLAHELKDQYDGDVEERKVWLKPYKDAMKFIGIGIEPRTEPFPGSCGIVYPILAETVTKFQAETALETLPPAGPVRTIVLGKETEENLAAARRVEEDMNNMITTGMPGFRSEHERAIWDLGLSGNAFKKVYFDPDLGKPVSTYVPSELMVSPSWPSTIEKSPRVTQVMYKHPNEVADLQALGFYRDVTLPDVRNGVATEIVGDNFSKVASEKEPDKSGLYCFLEVHCDVDLSYFRIEDKYAKPSGLVSPYVITIEESTLTVMAIRRNWDKEDPKKKKRQYFVHYYYIPTGYGLYAYGMTHLLGGYAESTTAIMRMLVDAGVFSNLPGGLKSKGLSMTNESPVAPGQFLDVDLMGVDGSLRDHIMLLPYKEPSQVLFMLLEKIVDETRRFAATADLKVSDMSAQAPVGTTYAILERTLRVMSAIQARIHDSMTKELRLLRDVVRDWTYDDYYYDPAVGERTAKQSDYGLVEVVPVFDPNASTMSQKMVRYQAILQLAQTSPQLYDEAYLHRQMLETIGVKNVHKIIPDEKKIPLLDPVTENMRLINGEPVKAYIGQDHEAHIIVHTSAMKDPQIIAMLSNNPKANQIMAAANEHLQEHLAFQYRRQIEMAAGVPLPAAGDVLDERTEIAVSQLAAAAAQRLLANNVAKAAAEKAQQDAADPLLLMQRHQMELEARDMRLKEQKFVADVKDKKDRLELEKEKLASKETVEGLKVGAKLAETKEALDAKEKLGVGLALSDVLQKNKY